MTSSIPTAIGPLQAQVSLTPQEIAEAFDVDVAMVEALDLVFADSYSDYEGGGTAVIYVDGNHLMLVEGYSWLSEDGHVWEPQIITLENAVSFIETFGMD
jgi:hypothetical protein